MKKTCIVLFVLMIGACSNQSGYELPLKEYPQSFHNEVSKLPKDGELSDKVNLSFTTYYNDRN
jgi:hypothetical protein